VPKLDKDRKANKDRKAGLICIVLMFQILTAGYFAKNETLKGVLVLIGVGFFITVLALMGKSIDKHGWK